MSAGKSIRVFGRWRAPDHAVDEVRQVLVQLARSTVAEPGCNAFEVWEAMEKPGQFILMEEFADDDAREFHRQTAHFKDLVLARSVQIGVEREGFAYKRIE